MKVVVAPDSFKGCLDAGAVAAGIGAELRRQRPDWDVVCCPLADGGEGTAAAVVGAGRGRWLPAGAVCGPLPGQAVTATLGWLPETRLAVVDSAAACGLPLLAVRQRNPLLTTTRGVGELLRRAWAQGAERVLLGLGGSATVDGGTGAARAWGWEFLDAAGRPLPEGGGALARLHEIVPPREHPAPGVLRVLCDVRNPLCGPAGAARVFAPQKGASPAMVAALEEGLERLATVCRRCLGEDICARVGGGAAGGLGAGSVLFLGGSLVDGFAAVADAVGLAPLLEGADWVVTGEGRLDASSFGGKVVGGVCACARRAGARVAVLAGGVALPETAWRRAGVDVALAVTPDDMPEAEAFRAAPALLRAAAGRLLAAWEPLAGAGPAG